MAGWHHRLDGCECEWTPGVGDGQGGLVCCNSWGCKESDTTERLNWTELKERKEVPEFCLVREGRRNFKETSTWELGKNDKNFLIISHTASALVCPSGHRLSSLTVQLVPVSPLNEPPSASPWYSVTKGLKDYGACFWDKILSAEGKLKPTQNEFALDMTDITDKGGQEIVVGE